MGCNRLAREEEKDFAESEDYFCRMVSYVPGRTLTKLGLEKKVHTTFPKPTGPTYVNILVCYMEKIKQYLFSM